LGCAVRAEGPRATGGHPRHPLDTLTMDPPSSCTGHHLVAPNWGGTTAAPAGFQVSRSASTKRGRGVRLPITCGEPPSVVDPARPSRPKCSTAFGNEPAPASGGLADVGRDEHPRRRHRPRGARQATTCAPGGGETPANPRRPPTPTGSRPSPTTTTFPPEVVERAGSTGQPYGTGPGSGGPGPTEPVPRLAPAAARGPKFRPAF